MTGAKSRDGISTASFGSRDHEDPAIGGSVDGASSASGGTDRYQSAGFGF
jgi:hypothetical protein